ncbi:MAG: ABC transporter ATP-binding protein [Verrucomicrobiota bacterium]|jgi:ABC-2 type transport system ATP-binding protein|nr:ABC transporter ATP-binding protein [Verrucomicrobiota bacterium]MDD8047519.1 ABC transporter ATP-binding protein [Verrucomicrobiota bacterium]MDD8050232.1 ABC transporter ATP-binding protein [Verrucomicrobiota bacterium]MDI9385479.1 ABC transporter ATP-binding protein [Verrucomicrobiota bacterium]
MGSDVEGLAIRLQGVRHLYHKTAALKGIDLEIPTGVVFGLVGSNGAGKTTTLRILGTLLRPTGGVVEVLGMDLAKAPDEVRRRIGYMPDFFGVYQDLGVSEYLDFFAAAYGLKRAKRQQVVGDVLELTGLTGKRQEVIGSLSRGMQQRLGLARVLVHDPSLLLLDEPASGLDPRARVEMAEILVELRNMGKTILISSHILPELQDMCDAFAILELGEILFTGTLKQLRAQVGVDGHDVRVRLEGEFNDLGFLPDERPEVLGVEDLGDGAWRLMLDPAGAWRAWDVSAWLVGRGYKVRSLEERTPNLQDAFMSMTKGDVT